MRSILLDIIPRRFRRRSYLVSGTIFLRALLNFAGLALLIPVLLLILDSESMHTNPWLERLYQAGRFESDRAFALTVCGCIVALIAFKNLLNLFLLRYERRYIYDLYRCMSRRLYIEYHDRGLGFIKNTNSALLSRNVNFVCLAFVTGILVPLASITSESMLLALLFTALLFYNPTVAGLVLLVFIPTVWFYYSAVRKRLHRYGVQENEAQREKARTVVETFRGYADLEINDAFPSMLRRFDRAMDKIVTIQSRNMTVNALPSIFMEVGLAIGMALFVAVSLGTPGDEARVLFGVFAVAGLRLMPSVRNMMSGWSALKYNRYTIDILRDIDLNDEKPEPSAAQPPLPFEREIAVRDLSFRFDDERGDKEVLHGLTLTIRKGEHVGIRGASGAGKTTLFNLLLGFYTPTGGEITIDGEPLTAANRRRWQNAVGYVSQHVFLLDGTLLENWPESNIFSIISSGDAVARVLPAAWGYHRNGCDRFLPATRNAEELADLDALGAEFGPTPLVISSLATAEDTSALINIVAKFCVSRENFHQKYEAAIMDMIQCAFIRSEKEVVDGYILSDGEIVERLQSLSHMKEINYWQIVGSVWAASTMSRPILERYGQNVPLLARQILIPVLAVGLCYGIETDVVQMVAQYIIRLLTARGELDSVLRAAFCHHPENYISLMEYYAPEEHGMEPFTRK